MKTGLEIATLINTGGRINSTFDADEIEPDFHRLLVNALYDMGFTNAKSLSACSKASSEHHLEKDGQKVEVISANFLGRFTQVKN
mgnify:CR=1 FL=1